MAATNASKTLVESTSGENDVVAKDISSSSSRRDNNDNGQDDDTTTVDTTVSSEAESTDNVFDDTTMEHSSSSTDEEFIWYFSYGSNMNPEVFETKRKIKCLDHKVCKVPGYILTYAQGVFPYIEPGFCTCLKRTDLPSDDGRPDIHGVAFLITRKQYEHMLLTEGGWGYQQYRNHSFWNIGHYGEEEIECVEIPSDECCSSSNSTSEERKEPLAPTPQASKPFKAMTLVGLFGIGRRYDCNASRRYYDLVNVGAESSGLPASYREYLRDQHPAYKPSNCKWATLACRIYMTIAFPCMVLELGLLHCCVLWNERKIKHRQLASETQSQPNTNITKRRQRFEDVYRPPWIVMKACFCYRTLVLELVMNTILFDWCKFPNGFRNPCAAAVLGASTATDEPNIASKKESQ